MKKQLLVAFALSLFSATATFAQTGNVISGDGTRSVPPPPREDIPAIGVQSNWRLPVNESLSAKSADGTIANLTLRKNALVAEKTVMATSGDDMGPQTSEVWSIPLSGSVNELVLKQDGNLVVLDTNKQVLWQTNTAGRGHLLKFYSDGVLDLFDKADRSVWRR